MAIRIVDAEKIRSTTAQQTGLYVGEGGDRRYFKAGARLFGNYRYEGPFDPQGRREPVKPEPKAAK